MYGFVFSVIDFQFCEFYSHHNIWRDAQVPQNTFRYYHPDSKSLDFTALMNDVKVHYTRFFYVTNRAHDNSLYGFCHVSQALTMYHFFNYITSCLIINALDICYIP